MSWWKSRKIHKTEGHNCISTLACTEVASVRQIRLLGCQNKSERQSKNIYKLEGTIGLLVHSLA